MRKALQIVIYIFAAIGFVLVVVYLAVEMGWTKTSGIIDRQHDFFKQQSLKNGSGLSASTSSDEWAQGEEWQTLKEAIIKDKEVINKVSKETGVSSRVIVSILIVEQLRLFHDNREIFKTIFAPLKILGNQSQFSWGVMGIKQDTAREIENNLKDSNSVWYLGVNYSHTLDFGSSTVLTSTTSAGIASNTAIPEDTDTQRFNRLTDEHDRYYSYLYAAILIKEIGSQWNKAGFPISDRPEILATLFNIGFTNSKPNADPQVGGAEISIGTSTYSFGGLAGSFYYSDKLINDFPR